MFALELSLTVVEAIWLIWQGSFEKHLQEPHLTIGHLAVGSCMKATALTDSASCNSTFQKYMEEHLHFSFKTVIPSALAIVSTIHCSWLLVKLRKDIFDFFLYELVK